MTSVNSFSTKLRRRRGATSPPLTNIHPNPGPTKKSCRRVAKQPQKEDHLGAPERKRIQELKAEGKSIAEIGGVLGVGSSAAKQGIFRAVQKMRRALEPVVNAIL